jgi:hypothetical protein
MGDIDEEYWKPFKVVPRLRGRRHFVCMVRKVIVR